MKGFQESFERRVEESLDIGIIYEEAKKILARNRIKEKDYGGKYKEEEILRDIQSAAEMEARITSGQLPETKMLADIFEALVSECGDGDYWFGKNVEVKAASRYDDFKNGIDAIVEFTERDGNIFLGLATDVTFSSDITDKLARMQENIGDGRLARPKYGPVSELPEVVVGAGRRTVLEAGRLLVAGQHKELAVHKLQIMLLIQAKAQLEAFILLARSKQRERIIPQLVGALRKIEEVLGEKPELVKRFGHLLEDDSVHRQIMATARNISVGAQRNLGRLNP